MISPSSSTQTTSLSMSTTPVSPLMSSSLSVSSSWTPLSSSPSRSSQSSRSSSRVSRVDIATPEGSENKRPPLAPRSNTSSSKDEEMTTHITLNSLFTPLSSISPSSSSITSTSIRGSQTSLGTPSSVSSISSNTSSMGVSPIPSPLPSLLNPLWSISSPLGNAAAALAACQVRTPESETSTDSDDADITLSHDRRVWMNAPSSLPSPLPVASPLSPDSKHVGHVGITN
jgi:hypothetical protein